MEQAGGGTGETGPRIRQPAPGNSGPRAGAAPAGALTHSAHSGGVGAPLGGTTASCQELADDRWACFAPSTKARPDAGRRTPQQSAERRAGPRHGPVISGDPEIGPLARRTIGCGASAPAPVGALLPSFFRGAETDEGHPGALAQTGRRSVVYECNASEGTRCPAPITVTDKFQRGYRYRLTARAPAATSIPNSSLSSRRPRCWRSACSAAST